MHSLDLKLRAEEFIDVHVDCNKVLTRPDIGTWAKNGVKIVRDWKKIHTLGEASVYEEI